MSIKDKIIAFDLDGTLANESGGLSEFTITEIQKLIKKGYQITFCTGRNLISSKDLYLKCHLNLMGVFCNGLIIYNPSNDETLQEIKISKEDFDSYLDNQELLSYLDDILIEIGDYNYAYNGHFFKNVTKVGDFRDYLLELPSSMVFALKDSKYEKKVNEIVQKINKNYSFRSWGVFGEFYNNKYDKKDGLEKLVKYYHKSKEDLIYFGDGSNDISALKYANIGIAMQNASKDVKDSANLVTDFDNTKDGAIKYLLKLIEEENENTTFVF